MPSNLRKTLFAVLPLAGLLAMTSTAFAGDAWKDSWEHDAIKRDRERRDEEFHQFPHSKKAIAAFISNKDASTSRWTVNYDGVGMAGAPTAMAMGGPTTRTRIMDVHRMTAPAMGNRRILAPRMAPAGIPITVEAMAHSPTMGWPIRALFAQPGGADSLPPRLVPVWPLRRPWLGAGYVDASFQTPFAPVWAEEMRLQIREYGQPAKLLGQ